MGECKGSSSAPLCNAQIKVDALQPEGADRAGDGTTDILRDDTSAKQHRQDEAVAAELRRSEGIMGLAQERSIRMLLCDKPEALGIPQARLAEIEVAAYGNAGYGQRAEGLTHFQKVFRGYTEHGPLRYVIIVEASSSADTTEPLLLVFGNYYEVRRYGQLGEAYAAAVMQWEQANPGQHPDSFIVSKLVTDPRLPRAAGLLGLGGLALGAVLRGLANTNASGIFVAARTQPESQILIKRLLPRLVPGLTLLLDQTIDGEGAGGAQACMLAHVFPR